MHDYFDILGVPPSAGAVDVRRVCAAHVRRRHPDFDPQAVPQNAVPAGRRDAAIEFVAMTTCLERIQQQFFASPPDVPSS